MINIPSDDKVMAFINTKDLKDEDYIANNYVVMCTKKGQVKKTSLESYSRPRQNGINAITIKRRRSVIRSKTNFWKFSNYVGSSFWKSNSI